MKALRIHDLSLLLEQEGESQDILESQGIINTEPILSCGDSQDDDDDDYEDDEYWDDQDDEPSYDETERPSVIVLGKIDLSVFDKPAKYKKPVYQEPEPMHGDETMLQEEEWEHRMSQPGGFWGIEDDFEDIEESSSPLGSDFDPSGYTDYPTQEDLREYGCISNQE